MQLWLSGFEHGEAHANGPKAPEAAGALEVLTHAASPFTDRWANWVPRGDTPSELSENIVPRTARAVCMVRTSCVAGRFRRQ
jgi:hypothetical protein